MSNARPTSPWTTRLLLVLTLSLSACGPTAPTPASKDSVPPGTAAGKDAAPAAPSSGAVKTLTIAAVETPQSFDKDLQQSTGSFDAQSNLAATLLRFGVRTDDKGVSVEDFSQVLPGLAESWTVSQDKLTYTFKLRQGVKSTFGNEFTADDVKWTYDRSFALQGLGVTSFGLEPFLDQAGVQVVDPYTVKFVLKRPNPVLLAILTSTASLIWDSKEARKHATDQEPWAKDWLADNGPTFGPYKVQSLTRGQEAVYVAHEGYYLGAPPIKRVVYKAVPASANRLALLETGAVDVAFELTPLELNQVKEKPGMKITSTPGSRFMALIFNQTKPPFDNFKVRQAIAFATPYDDILTNVYRGWGTPWQSVIASNQPGYSAEYWPYKTDLDRARSLLTEAGHPQGFNLVITSNVEQAAAQDIGVHLRTNLEKIGIRAQIENLPAAAYTDKRLGGSFEAMLWQAQALVADAGYTMNIYYRIAARPNWGKFNNPEVDKAIEQGLSLFDEERTKYYSKLQKTVLEATPLIPIAQPGFQFAASANVSGFVYHNGNYVLFSELDKK